MYDALKELMRPEIEEAREDGIEQGLEQGIEQGLERGREQGRKEGIRDTFRDNVNSLIKNGVSIDVLYRSFGKEAVDNAVRDGK